MQAFKYTCYLLLSFFSLTFGCRKNSHTAMADNNGGKANNGITDTILKPVVSVIHLGSGAGNLIIDGSSIAIKDSTVILIKEGTYNNITIQNLHTDSGNRVYVANNGIVHVREAMYIENISNVTISGGYDPGEAHGIRFENIAYRAIRISGKMNGLTLRNLKFTNVGDYVISTEGRLQSFDGTTDTRTERFKILYCLFDDAGTIHMGGNLDEDGDYGLFKDVEIAHNTFKNSEWGSVCAFSNVQDYNVHHNIVTGINQENDNHNGIFHLQGNGQFHHNILTDYQGNAIRAWIFSRGDVPATVEIYNNICYNTRKYGAFELQQFKRHLVSGKTTYAHAKVFQNTVGRMNTSKDWEGQILDLYQLSGTLSYYSNLGFELYSSNSYKPVTDMINNMSSTQIIRYTDNIYYEKQENAIDDTIHFQTKIPGIGAGSDEK